MAPKDYSTSISTRRQRLFSAGLAWRVPLALLISFLIMLAFFATSATSH
jgi:hypothetical protein